MFVFVHASGIKTVHTGVGVKNWQNSVHVVVECPLTENFSKFAIYFYFSNIFFPHFLEQVLYIGGSALEVSKSQKQIFLKLYFPKNERNIGFGLGNRTLIELFGSGKTVKHCFGRSLGHQ